MSKTKPIHVKPSFYALCFYDLKEIAARCGYNLVLHGSLNRDMDLIAIPWIEKVSHPDYLIGEMNVYLGGDVMNQTKKNRYCFPHGRMSYVINLNRGDFGKEDPQYYIDISVIPKHE